MKKLSIVISAYNEQRKIRACLESVKFADEIIFVDNSSTDKTVKIAKEFTKKIYIQPNDPANIDLQKNLGIAKATGDWVFVLDADEQITPELANELQEMLELDSRSPIGVEDKLHGNDMEKINGYWVPRKNIIFGKWMQHSGWYPDPQLRLFRKGKGKYEKAHYHEPIAVAGKIDTLKEHILHHNYERVGQVLYRNLQVYAPNEAEELLRKGYKFSYADAVRLPVKEFLSRFFAREGYKDGFHGLILAFFMAMYHFSIFAYIWEQKKFIDEEDALAEVGIETKNSEKEISYWVNKRYIDEEKDLIKKTLLRIKRKLQ